MKEIFKTIQNFPNYEISNMGKIRNIKKNKILQPHKITNDALQITFCTKGTKKQRLVSRIVVENFMNTNLSKENVVYHIDRNKENNSISNLQVWENISLLKEYLLTSGITTNPAYLK